MHVTLPNEAHTADGSNEPERTYEMLSGYIARLAQTIAAYHRSILFCLFCLLSFSWFLKRYKNIERQKISEKRKSSKRRLLYLYYASFLAATALTIWYHPVAFSYLGRLIKSRLALMNIMWSAVVVAVFTLLARAAEIGLIKEEVDIKTRHKLRKAIAFSRTAGIVFCLLLIWGSKVQNLGVFLGMVGAGLAMSMQELLLGVAGWLFIVIKRPFDIGDRMGGEGKRGDARDLPILPTTLLEVGNWVNADQSTGRLLVIPNGRFFRQVNFNYTKGFPFIWNELTVIVTYESDWRKAKEIMLKHSLEEADKIEAEVRKQIQAMQSKYAIRYKQLTPIVYTSIADNGIALTLRYLTPVRARRATSHQLSEAILDEILSAPDIDFAYPTTRFFDNVREGKPAIRSPIQLGERATVGGAG